MGGGGVGGGGGGLHAKQDEQDVLRGNQEVMRETPASLGYRMPAEWEEHEATWISWPKDPHQNLVSPSVPTLFTAHTTTLLAMA